MLTSITLPRTIASRSARCFASMAGESTAATVFIAASDVALTTGTQRPATRVRSGSVHASREMASNATSTSISTFVWRCSSTIMVSYSCTTLVDPARLSRSRARCSGWTRKSTSAVDLAMPCALSASAPAKAPLTRFSRASSRPSSRPHRTRSTVRHGPVVCPSAPRRTRASARCPSRRPCLTEHARGAPRAQLRRLSPLSAATRYASAIVG